MRLVLSIIIFLYTVVAFAQGDLYSESRIYNNNESSFGIDLISNGMGFNYKIGKRVDGRRKIIYQLDFSWFKHPKEIKIKTYDSGNRFVYGKMNFPTNFRFSVGRQKVLYERKDQNGVKISYFYTGGVSLALLKPVYYNIITGGVLTEQQFDITEIHTYSQIHSRASFFKGFNEISFVPGASIKLGFDFDFASSDDRIHALEAGANLDIYYKELEIMATERNNMVLFTLFVTYRFGRLTKTTIN